MGRIKLEMQARHLSRKVTQPVGDRGVERCLDQAKRLQITGKARLGSPDPDLRPQTTPSCAATLLSE